MVKVYGTVSRNAWRLGGSKVHQCVRVDSITDRQHGSLKYKEICYTGEDGKCSVLTHFDINGLRVGDCVSKDTLKSYSLSYKDVCSLRG